MANQFLLPTLNAQPSGVLSQSLVGAVNATAGTQDAGKVVLLDASGQLSPSMVPGSGSVAFSGILSGVNTAAMMTIGSGASIVVSGTGLIQATQVWNVLVSSTAPTTGQVLTATSPTTADWQTPSSGTSVFVNSTSVPNPNFGNLPAAPGTNTLITWQFSGSNVSAYAQLPQTFAAISHEFLKSYDAVTGVFTAAQPAYSDISGTPTAPTSTPAVSHEFLTSYDSSTGVFGQAQPASTDLSDAGTLVYNTGSYSNPSWITSILGSIVSGNISGDAASITGTITYSQVTGVPAFPANTPAVTHEFITAYNSTTGVFTQAQPAYSDISGTPQLAQTFAPVTHEFLTGYTASTGLFTAAQPAYSDISGTPNLSVYALLAGATFTGAVVVPSLSISGTLTDGSSSVGTSGQYLSSTVTGTKWVSTPITAYAATIGDGSSLTYTVTHSLGTEDVIVNVYNISTGETDIVDVDRTSTNAITVTFAVAPSTNSERVVILSNGGTASSGGGGIYPALTPPVSTNFTWNNPSTFPETTTDYPTKMLVLLPSAATGLWLVQNTALPATPYTIDLAAMVFASNNINVVSILLSNSGLTNARVFGPRVDTAVAGSEYGAWSVVDQSWTGPISPGSENFIYLSDGMSPAQHLVFVRVTNDGTNLNIYWSANGENYILLQTTTVGSLGFSPTTTGIVFYNTSGPMNVWCYHWLVSGSILPQNS